MLLCSLLVLDVSPISVRTLKGYVCMYVCMYVVVDK